MYPKLGPRIRFVVPKMNGLASSQVNNLCEELPAYPISSMRLFEIWRWTLRLYWWMYGVFRCGSTKLLLPFPKGISPSPLKSTFCGGGICEGNGSGEPAVPYGSDIVVFAAFVGLGLKNKSALPAKGGSSVAQSDIQPFNVS